MQGKRRKHIINPRFYFTDTRKQLWNCCNIYESVVSLTSPLRTITDPLKEIKIVKMDGPKKDFKSNFLFARSFRYNCQNFYEKKISLFIIPLKRTYLNSQKSKTPFLCQIFNTKQNKTTFLCLFFKAEKRNLFFVF